MLKSTFIPLTIRLEAFTHLVPVPFAIYMASITQEYSLEDWIRFLVLCCGSGLLMVVAGCFWRFQILRKLFIELENLKNTEEQLSENIINENEIDLLNEKEDYHQKAKRLKLFLFRYPFYEGFVIILRWFIGVGLIFALTPILGLYRQELWTTFLSYLIMIPPISFVAYYFITENSFRTIFNLKMVRQVRIEPEEIPKFDYFKRILISFFSLAALPVTVLSYMLISVANGDMNVKNPLLQVLVIGGIFVLPLVFVAYLVAKAVRTGIRDTSKLLDELAKGNFTVVSMPSSGDDFGQQSFHMNRVIEQLNTMYTEIFTLNIGLESKVKERTLELEKSLSEVNALKFQQDGDYFLTHLLLKPLGKNQVKSERVDIQFLLRQKKKFEFRGKEYEIGGDLNIAHNIILQGKKYTVFVNSDAMGKSMQGAGGALVLGAVFQSIIERTLFSSSTFSQAPERWLKNAFIEMHKIFEGFDGSMLVSLIIGLIEENSGFLYFINAEHPWLILFRDGKASFLETELSYRKLGTKGIESGVFIKTFLLHPGDVLISGSDGKDDLVLHETKQMGNDRLINHDENLILKYIEEARGDLPSLYEKLKSAGEITDDLSIVRVGYTGRPPERMEDRFIKTYKEAKKIAEAGDPKTAILTLKQLLSEFPHTHAKLHKLLAKLLFKNKEYANAAEHAQAYMETHPSDLPFMELTSILWRKAGRLHQAIEIAERIRLRDPNLTKNAFHLVSLYLMTGNRNRADTILKEWESSSRPLHDEKWKKLKFALESKIRKSVT